MLPFTTIEKRHQALQGETKPRVYCVALLDKDYSAGVRTINCEARLVTERFGLAHDCKDAVVRHSEGRATQVAKAEKIMDLIRGSLGKL